MNLQNNKKMSNALYLYNSLSGKKEEFIPINQKSVSKYVCGPTVYSDAHMGNCRTYISFDLIFDKADFF